MNPTSHHLGSALRAWLLTLLVLALLSTQLVDA